MPDNASMDIQSASHGRIRRTHMVWGVLLGAMTLGGGGLLLLEDQPLNAPGYVQLEEAAAPSDDLNQIFSRLDGADTSRWSGIVVHHSGSLGGSPESLDATHRAAGLNGLGYHFVISNGQGAQDGSIHVGSRWLSQLPGAHTTGPNADFYNTQAIGICLVGDGERRRFTKAQIRALGQLVDTLRGELSIEPEEVVLHRDVAPTSSPGRLFPRAAFRRGLMNDQ